MAADAAAEDDAGTGLESRDGQNRVGACREADGVGDDGGIFSGLRKIHIGQGKLRGSLVGEIRSVQPPLIRERRRAARRDGETRVRSG